MTTERAAPDQIAICRSLYLALADLDWPVGSREICGTLVLDERLCALLNDASDLDIELRIFQEDRELMPSEFDGLASGQHVKISFEPTRKPQAFFARDFDDFLASHNFLVKPPRQFYVADKGIFHATDTVGDGDIVSAYLCAVDFISFLEEEGVPDHSTPASAGQQRSLLMLGHEKKIEIQVNYNARDLESSGKAICTALENLKEHFGSELHKDDKRLLLKQAIMEIVTHQKKEARFSALLERAEDLLHRYEGNYELFTKKYSFETERQKLLGEKRDFLVRVNDTIGSAQARLLAIPLSIFLVASQMRPVTIASDSFTNLAILLGAFIFSSLISRLTDSQKSSLSAIGREVDERREYLETQYSHLYSSVREEFGDLKARVRQQSTTLLLIDLMAAVVVALAIAAFFYFDTNLHLAKMISKAAVTAFAPDYPFL